MTFDVNLKHKFRDRVNDSYFVLHVYRNAQGKNKWNCICSAMDWIDVTIEYINSSWDSNKNINIRCMNFYTYISSIDIMWEAIQQLHRVFFKTSKIPFIGDTTCFLNRAFEDDDNNYFKTIRACFGAHSTNLDEPSQPDNKDLKRFASWPFEGKYGWSKGDFEIRLYSNQPDEDDISFGVKIDELNKFSLKRYQYLNDIMKEIDRQYNQFLCKYRNKKFLLAGDVKEQLSILKEESKIRLNNDYYKHSIEELSMVYIVQSESEKNNILLEKYKEKLILVINEIYDNLQNMKFVDLKSDRILSPDFPSELHYSFEKLSSAAWGGSALYAYETMQKFLEDMIDFDKIKDINELYVMTLVGLYFKQDQKEKVQDD
ncbi:MAG TPA: hypothetical protein VIK78_12585 [Ruminiclostridium sp.]